MSRNDVVLVIRSTCNGRARYYVVARADADTQWNETYARAHAACDTSHYTHSRAKALVRAHDLQWKHKTEYGVRELRV